MTRVVTKMQWVDELPGRPHHPRKPFYAPRGSTQDLHDHAAQLLQHPMRWAKYPRPLGERQAKMVASRITEGALAAYHPDKGFEAVCRGTDIYVRHNPACANMLIVSYTQGFRAGVAATAARVRAQIGELRQTLAEMEGLQ